MFSGVLLLLQYVLCFPRNSSTVDAQMLFCRIKHRRYMWDGMHQRSQDTLGYRCKGARAGQRDCTWPASSLSVPLWKSNAKSLYFGTWLFLHFNCSSLHIAREFIGLMDVCCYSVASSSFSRPASSPPVHVATMIFSSSHLESIPGPLVGIHRHFFPLSCL